MKSYAHKIGAIFYILWGLLHVAGGAVLLQQLSAEGVTGVLAVIGSAVPAQDLPVISGGVTGAVLAYYAWNIIWFGIFAIVVAVALNWKNSSMGYWLNLLVLGAIDLGLFFALLLPGYMKMSDGMMGVGLWILAAIFSTIGLIGRQERFSQTVTA